MLRFLQEQIIKIIDFIEEYDLDKKGMTKICYFLEEEFDRERRM